MSPDPNVILQDAPPQHEPRQAEDKHNTYFLFLSLSFSLSLSLSLFLSLPLPHPPLSLTLFLSLTLSPSLSPPPLLLFFLPFSPLIQDWTRGWIIPKPFQHSLNWTDGDCTTRLPCVSKFQYNIITLVNSLQTVYRPILYYTVCGCKLVKFLIGWSSRLPS